MRRPRRPRGFTLVEVLVSLFILAVTAGMSWRGIDGIVRARDASQERLDRQLRLQSVIAQWEVDLAELQDGLVVPPLNFDGSSLRLTRRGAGGLQLVVWSLRGTTWTRWISPPVTQSAELQELWLRSQQLIGNEPGQLRALDGVAQWQVYYYRDNAWTNSQSSAGTPEGGAGSGAGRPALPTGVRLLIEFGQNSGFAGPLTRDVRLGPQIS